MDIRKTILFRKSANALARVIKEVVKSLFLEVSKKHGDMSPRGMVSGHGWDGLAIVLDCFRGLIQP